ncbi:Pleckstrin -like proteiny domain-containing family G member 4B [Triplophysa tibetana]|uniref:Pleckstrin-like proteiny domain-containing family G member 4B n=1 Tax=Triplophysa tibetana TaxID=1572043 RepID=A0A5A9NY37_9TELE|nr:Pleckstrin -like proteiny domain-containing family G member 4B [Triplophysa tibetana]
MSFDTSRQRAHTNPSSLEWSIQSTLSALYPPFEATAPTVLSQLFRTIEERYHGDALQCLLDFLIPAKHILESVQQAACAAYSDVLFRCEGWPLCLSDRVVVQLAPINPLLLRPGDFYLQVEPFGDQSARIVLKSLLMQEDLLGQDNLVFQAGSRVPQGPEVEGIPIPETSYPSIFTKSWLREINEGRHGNPLHQCVLSSDRGVVKVPWTEISKPEFLERPKANTWAETTSCMMATLKVDDLQTKFPENVAHSQLPVDLLQLEMETRILPAEDGMVVSVQLVEGGTRLVKVEQGNPISSFAGKPVGWVSPNTWDSRHDRELEGEYVDLLEFTKEKQTLNKIEMPTQPLSFKLVRTAQPEAKSNLCDEHFSVLDKNSILYLQPKQPSESMQNNLESKCSSRENSPEQCTSQQSPDTAQAKHHKSHDLHETAMGNKALPDKRLPCLNDSIRQDQFQVRVGGQKHAKTQHLPKMGLRALPDHSGLRQDLCLRRLNVIQQNQLTQNSEQTSLLFQRQCSQIQFQNENSPSDYKISSDDRQRGRDLDSPAQVLKVPGKSRPKFRSSSSVSETARECKQSHKVTNRSHSDIYPGIIPTVSIIQGIKHTANLVSPKLTRRQERKVSLSGILGTPVGNGGVLQDINNDQIQMSRTESAGQATLFSQDPTIKSLLQLGMICLPGNRDRAGRAVVEVYGGRKGWGAAQHSPLDLCRLLLYLHSIPRMEVRDLGLTVVIDSRKSPLPSVFYKSLLLVQEQALHAVHTIVMLVEKDMHPRPERHPGLQIDVVTSLKALHKVVDAQQLTSDLGGNFPYSHEDWLQFHQKLSLFQLDLQAASSLLHAAIRKLDVKKTDSAQEVMSCIDEQRSSMKIVLEDTRLVALQREGGAILARMRKEEPRYVHSEDNRHSMESVTCLYNQVEEAVHTLVMKSNQSLQHLEHVLLLRETADTLDRIQTWCNGEEQARKDNVDKEETLPKLEQKLRDIQSVLMQAKEKKEKGMLLIKAVKRNRQETQFHETDSFRCTVTSFKTNMTGFLLRAEERKSELETSLDLYRFCEQVSQKNRKLPHLLSKSACNRGYARYCRPLLAIIQRTETDLSNRYPSKSKAHPKSGTSDAPKRLKTMLHVSQPSRKRRTRRFLRLLLHWKSTILYLRVNGCHSSNIFFVLCGRKSFFKLIYHNIGKTLKPSITLPHTIGGLFRDNSRLLVHHPVYYTATCHMRKKLDMKYIFIFNFSKKKLRGCYLGIMDLQMSRLANQNQAFQRADKRKVNIRKLRLIIEELLKTEREYVRALWYVVEHYMPELERPDVPQDLRGQRGSIFGNLEKLRDFHQHYFLKELEICLQEPFGVGRCFLKHKENFGLYALYSKNKPCSEELLISHGKEFFKEKQQLLGDKMDLSSYLLKPVQRISKYSLLLQDMLRECDSGHHTGHERVEIQTALEIIHFQLRHGNDLLAMDDIQHCDVNLKEQGQLIRQDAFLLTFRKKKCQRHIFLFRDLILFSKTRKTDVGNDTYIYKQSFKTSDIGMTHSFGDSGLCFEIWFRRRKTQDTYILQAQSREVKENWTRDLERILWEQAIHNRGKHFFILVFMGIGHKPFMDITPSEMAINDRAINCALTGRGGLPVLRLNSTGSASCTSSSGSHSSSSSGWGSPVGHLIGPTSRDVVRFGHETSGILEEEDLDQDSGNQSVLVDSSESSGESVSCFSSSGHSSQSVIGGCGEHRPSEVPVIGVKKLSAHKQESNRKPANPPIQPSSKVQGRNIMAKSTEV